MDFENIPVALLRAIEQVPAKLLQNNSLNADFLIRPFTHDLSVLITAQSGNIHSSVIVDNPDAQRITNTIKFLTHTNANRVLETIKPEIPSVILGKKILIVDDNLTNKTIIEIVLKDIGAETTVANDGPEAIQLMQTNSYDVFIFDRHMPEMSGHELLNETRNIYKTDNLKAILLTADISEEVSEEAISSGFVVCVHKPFEPSLLIDEVEKLFTA